MQYDYVYAPMCLGNDVTGPDGINAQNNYAAAANLCLPPNTVGFWVFGRAVGGTGAYDLVASNQCFGADFSISIADAQALLADFLKTAQLPAPTVTVLPVGPGLVQLPIIAYCTALPTMSLSTDIGVPATITAVPHYVWDFGDTGGTATNVGDWTGQPYTGVSPRTRPADYITHIYTEKGTYPVGVTIRWEATFQVDGLANVLPLNPEVRAEPALAYQVLEARAVLTGNS